MDRLGNGWVGALVRNGGLLMGGNIVHLAIGLAAQLALMRLLAPADFGSFALVLASTGLIQMVLSPRLGVLAIRAREEEYTEEFRHRLYSAMAIESAATLAVMVLWLAVVGVGSAWTYLLAATLALGHWVNSAATFFERRMPYRPIVVAETVSQAAAHALAVGLAFAGAGVAALYLREAAAVALKAGMLARVGALPNWPIRRVSLPEWRSLLKDARALWLDGIVDGGFQRLTVLAAGAFGGAHGAGLFSQAQRLAIVPHQLLSPVVVRLAGNVFSRIEARDDRRRTLARVAGALALPLTGAAAAAWAFADPIVPWLFGPKWQDAAGVLAAMAGMVIGYSFFELGRSYCLAQRLDLLLGAGRLAQYGIFAGGCLFAVGADPARELGLVLSASLVAAAAVVLAGLALAREGRGR